MVWRTLMNQAAPVNLLNSFIENLSSIWFWETIIRNSDGPTPHSQRETGLKFKNTRRAPRYLLEVDVEVTDLESGMRVKEKTKDLSLFGCGIDTSVAFPRSRKVRIEIVHEDEKMLAVGRVVYAEADIGMGVAFIRVEPEDQRILERWIEQQMCPPSTRSECPPVQV